MFGFTVHTSMWFRKNHSDWHNIWNFWIQNWWRHFVKSSDDTNKCLLDNISKMVYVILWRFVVDCMFPALHFCKKKSCEMANQIFVLFYRFDQSNLLKGIDNKTVKIHSFRKHCLHKDLVFISWQLMSALASLERFGEDHKLKIMQTLFRAPPQM